MGICENNINAFIHKYYWPKWIPIYLTRPDALCTAVPRLFNQYIRFVQREVEMHPLISAEAALTQELQKLWGGGSG